MTNAGAAPKGLRDRRSATRLLAHRLFHRAATHGAEANLETALRLVDERLASGPGIRREVAAEAHRLCRAALAQRESGGLLEGRLRTNLRVGIREEGGGARVVLIPTLIEHPEGVVSVVVMQPEGEPGAWRGRRYRQAARILFDRPIRPIRVVLVRADGTLRSLGTTRSGPREGAYRDRGCSPSDHPRSGRTRR